MDFFNACLDVLIFVFKDLLPKMWNAAIDIADAFSIIEEVTSYLTPVGMIAARIGIPVGLLTMLFDWLWGERYINIH